MLGCSVLKITMILPTSQMYWMNSFVLLKLEIELRTNLTYYMNFVPETVDILSKFQLYRDWKMFDTITGDILLPALSNCFRTKLFVVVKGSFNNLVPMFHLIPHSVQTPSEIQKTYYLLRTSMNAIERTYILCNQCTS